MLLGVLVSYLTRLSYSAVLVEMILKEGYGKNSASAALTGLFITYGLARITENLGWGATMNAWCVSALAGVITVACTYRMLRKIKRFCL